MAEKKLIDWVLLIINQNGSINDEFHFDSYEEAKQNLDFYKSFYGSAYSYKVVPISATVSFNVNFIY